MVIQVSQEVYNAAVNIAEGEEIALYEAVDKILAGYLTLVKIEANKKKKAKKKQN